MQSKFATLTLFLIFLAGCSTTPREAILHLAKSSGFTEVRFPTEQFTLFGQFRPSDHGERKTLRVYIEGDGHAWSTRTRPSGDPTPRDPVGLRLAMADPSHDPVLYLARPCQFVTGSDLRNCSAKYWTSARLAPEVIASLNEAINKAKATYGAEKIILVGFSGGGGAALLLAAHRTDVIFLGTVAGNLDTDAWAKLHGISPLAESLNPIDVAPSLQNMPQLHLSSADDTIMPPEISERLCRAAQQPQNCRVVKGVQHGGEWQEFWEYQKGTKRTCN